MPPGKNPLHPFRTKRLSPHEKPQGLPGEDLRQTVVVESWEFEINLEVYLALCCLFLCPSVLNKILKGISVSDFQVPSVLDWTLNIYVPT